MQDQAKEGWKSSELEISMVHVVLNGPARAGSERIVLK